MLSRLPIIERQPDIPLDLTWYGRGIVPTVIPVVVAGSEEDAYLWRLGRTVQRIRKKLHKWKQSDLATEVGREIDTISRWENGKTSLSAHDLTQLWRALKVPGEWLLDPTDSLTELDQQIEALRLQRVREAASVAGRAEVEDEQARRAGGAIPPLRGTRKPRKPPRSPR